MLMALPRPEPKGKAEENYSVTVNNLPSKTSMIAIQAESNVTNSIKEELVIACENKITATTKLHLKQEENSELVITRENRLLITATTKLKEENSELVIPEGDICKVRRGLSTQNCAKLNALSSHEPLIAVSKDNNNVDKMHLYWHTPV